MSSRTATHARKNFLFPAQEKKGKPKKITTRKQHPTARTIEIDTRIKSPAKTSPAACQLRLEASPPLLAAPVRPPCSTASHRWKHRRPPMAAPPPPLAAAAIGVCSSGGRRLELRGPTFAAPAAGVLHHLQQPLSAFATPEVDVCSSSGWRLQHQLWAPPPPPGVVVRSSATSPCSSYRRRSKQRRPAVVPPAAFPCSTTVVLPPLAAATATARSSADLL